MHCSPVNIYFLLLSDSFLQEVAGLGASRCGGNPIHQGRARRVGLFCLTISRHLPDSSSSTADTCVTSNVSWHWGTRTEKQVATYLKMWNWKNWLVVQQGVSLVEGPVSTHKHWKKTEKYCYSCQSNIQYFHWVKDFVIFKLKHKNQLTVAYIVLKLSFLI